MHTELLQTPWLLLDIFVSIEVRRITTVLRMPIHIKEIYMPNQNYEGDYVNQSLGNVTANGLIYRLQVNWFTDIIGRINIINIYVCDHVYI